MSYRVFKVFFFWRCAALRFHPSSAEITPKNAFWPQTLQKLLPLNRADFQKRVHVQTYATKLRVRVLPSRFSFHICCLEEPIGDRYALLQRNTTPCIWCRVNSRSSLFYRNHHMSWLEAHLQERKLEGETLFQPCKVNSRSTFGQTPGPPKMPLKTTTSRTRNNAYIWTQNEWNRFQTS